jgi:low affinity Fe/Cu permease
MKFSAVSQSLSRWAGSARTFYAAVALIGLWSLSGPYFHYNDTWQLIINTSTTIITFLMVFLIQNTQNRDNDILHIKIDELLRRLLDSDDMPTAQLWRSSLARAASLSRLPERAPER